MTTETLNKVQDTEALVNDTRKAELLKSQVEHIDITSFDARPIVEAMGKMSFTSRDLARAAGIYNQMLADPECSVWLVIAVVSRDILIVGAVVLSWMLSRPLSMQPLLISKANTFSQIVLAGFVLAELGLGLGLHEVINLLIWVTGTLTIVSAAVYFWQWLGHMASYEPAPAPLPPRQRKAASHDQPQSSRARAS